MISFAYTHIRLKAVDEVLVVA